MTSSLTDVKNHFFNTESRNNSVSCFQHRLQVTIDLDVHMGFVAAYRRAEVLLTPFLGVSKDRVRIEFILKYLVQNFNGNMSKT